MAWPHNLGGFQDFRQPDPSSLKYFDASQSYSISLESDKFDFMEQSFSYYYEQISFDDATCIFGLRWPIYSQLVFFQNIIKVNQSYSISVRSRKTHRFHLMFFHNLHFSSNVYFIELTWAGSYHCLQQHFVLKSEMSERGFGF